MLNSLASCVVMLCAGRSTNAEKAPGLVLRLNFASSWVLSVSVNISANLASRWVQSFSRGGGEACPAGGDGGSKITQSEPGLTKKLSRFLAGEASRVDWILGILE